MSSRKIHDDSTIPLDSIPSRRTSKRLRRNDDNHGNDHNNKWSTVANRMSLSSSLSLETATVEAATAKVIPSLLTLPDDLLTFLLQIIVVSNGVTNARLKPRGYDDAYSLAQTCHRLYALFDNVLWRHGATRRQLVDGVEREDPLTCGICVSSMIQPSFIPLLRLVPADIGFIDVTHGDVCEHLARPLLKAIFRLCPLVKMLAFVDHPDSMSRRLLVRNLTALPRLRALHVVTPRSGLIPYIGALQGLRTVSLSGIADYQDEAVEILLRHCQAAVTSFAVSHASTPDDCCSFEMFMFVPNSRPGPVPNPSIPITAASVNREELNMVGDDDGCDHYIDMEDNDGILEEEEEEEKHDATRLVTDLAVDLLHTFPASCFRVEMITNAFPPIGACQICHNSYLNWFEAPHGACDVQPPRVRISRRLRSATLCKAAVRVPLDMRSCLWALIRMADPVCWHVFRTNTATLCYRALETETENHDEHPAVLEADGNDEGDENVGLLVFDEDGNMENEADDAGNLEGGLDVNDERRRNELVDTLADVVKLDVTELLQTTPLPPSPRIVAEQQQVEINADGGEEQGDALEQASASVLSKETDLSHVRAIDVRVAHGSTEWSDISGVRARLPALRARLDTAARSASLLAVSAFACTGAMRSDIVALASSVAAAAPRVAALAVVAEFLAAARASCLLATLFAHLPNLRVLHICASSPTVSSQRHSHAFTNSILNGGHDNRFALEDELHQSVSGEGPGYDSANRAVEDVKEGENRDGRVGGSGFFSRLCNLKPFVEWLQAVPTALESAATSCVKLKKIVIHSPSSDRSLLPSEQELNNRHVRQNAMEEEEEESDGLVSMAVAALNAARASVTSFVRERRDVDVASLADILETWSMEFETFCETSVSGSGSRSGSGSGPGSSLDDFQPTP